MGFVVHKSCRTWRSFARIEADMKIQSRQRIRRSSRGKRYEEPVMAAVKNRENENEQAAPANKNEKVRTNLSTDYQTNGHISCEVNEKQIHCTYRSHIHNQFPQLPSNNYIFRWSAHKCALLTVLTAYTDLSKHSDETHILAGAWYRYENPSKCP